MAAPTNYADDNIIDLASTNPTPVRIEDIYDNKYASKWNDALAAHQFEWTMFAMLVKGKDVKAAVKSASERNPLVHVHGGFIVNTKDPSPSDLTLKRLSACLLYDNCSNLDGKMRLCLLTTPDANRPRNAGLLVHLSHVGTLELDNAPAACGLDPAHSTDTPSKSSRGRCMIMYVSCFLSFLCICFCNIGLRLGTEALEACSPLCLGQPSWNMNKVLLLLSAKM